MKRPQILATARSLRLFRQISCIAESNFHQTPTSRKKVPRGGIATLAHRGKRSLGGALRDAEETHLLDEFVNLTSNENYKLGSSGMLIAPTEFAPGGEGNEDQTLLSKLQFQLAISGVLGHLPRINLRVRLHRPHIKSPREVTHNNRNEISFTRSSTR